MSHGLLSHDGLILLPGGRSLIDSRAIARDVERGHLIKLRRATYVERADWDLLDDRGRHLLRVRAVLAVARRPVMVAGPSAAAVWGMPIMGRFPDEVTLLDAWIGGGRSEPGVIRTAAGFATAQQVMVDGFPVTTLARTALSIAQRETPRDAMGSVDWTLWRKNPRAISKSELAEELRRWNPRAGSRQLEFVVGSSTHLSDSMGESECRAVIGELGFEVPALQVQFRDEQGSMEPDYLWLGAHRFGEFDGKAKYTRNEYSHGNPGEVVWREKKREDRLGRKGLSGVRILTEHVKNPRRLEHLLIEAGIPRRGGSS